MSDEITAAAANAGAIDAAEISALIPPGGAGSATDQVAALKAAKPYLFRPDAAAMTPAEYAAAKAEIVRADRARQRAASEARTLERITKRYEK
jgi:hypothetical protein